MMNPNIPELPLKDIHLPDPISFWPVAIGWWILLTLFLIFSVISYGVYKKLTKTTLKSEAKNKLEGIEKKLEETGDPVTCLTEISELLRRITLSQHAGQDFAGLTGQAWLQFLDKPLKTSEFSEGAGRILLTGPYSLQVDKTKVVDLIQLTHKWVRAL